MVNFLKSGIKDLNVRQDTIKLLQGNRQNTLTCHSDIFFFCDLSPKAKETKTKINKWDLIKLKDFCRVKITIDKMKRQPTEWEKIFANDMTDKGLISKIYKEPYNSTSKK